MDKNRGDAGALGQAAEGPVAGVIGGEGIAGRRAAGFAAGNLGTMAVVVREGSTGRLSLRAGESCR
jgi:hypothetical protein